MFLFYLCVALEKFLSCIGMVEDKECSQVDVLTRKRRPILTNETPQWAAKKSIW